MIFVKHNACNMRIPFDLFGPLILMELSPSYPSVDGVIVNPGNQVSLRLFGYLQMDGAVR